MDDIIVQTLNVSAYRENWSLIFFSNNSCLIRGIEEVLRTEKKYQILEIISSKEEIYPTLQQVKPDLFLISHPNQIQIASSIKKKYPTIFIILWDGHYGGDAYCSSTAPLLLQLDKIVLLKSLGNLTFTIRGQAIYHELVKKTAISSQEKRILHYLSYGYSYPEIAETLKITLNTLKIYMAELREKLNAKDKTHLLAIAFRTGLVV